MNRILTSLMAGALALAFCGGAAAQSFTVDFGTSRVIGSGQAALVIENIRINQAGQELGYNVVWRLDPVTLELVPESIAQYSGNGASNCAAVNVQVYNASVGTASRITGASVSVGSRSSFTSSTGIASFSGVTEGAASVLVTATGYSNGSQVANVTCAGTHTIEVGLTPVQ